MILVDTSALIDSLTGKKRSAPKLRAFLADGERMVVASLVLYEWWRGPRLESELAAQEVLFPAEAAIGFGAEEAMIAASLYRTVDRPRGRELDLAVAACALAWKASLWTLNQKDFRDIPGLQMVG